MDSAKETATAHAATASALKGAGAENLAEAQSFMDTVKSAFQPALAGGLFDKIVYFSVLLFCVITFISGLTQLGEEARALVYEVASEVQPSVTLPAMYYCPFPDMAEAANYTVEVENGQQSQFSVINGVRTNINDPIEVPSAIYSQLKTAFEYTTQERNACINLNSKASITAKIGDAKRSKYVGTLIETWFAQRNDPSGKQPGTPMAFIGFYDSKLKSPFDATGKLISQPVISPMANTVSVIDITVEETTTIKGWISRTSSTVTKYIATATSGNYELDYLSRPVPGWNNSWGTPGSNNFGFNEQQLAPSHYNTIIELRLATFVKNKVTIRNKTFSEIWAAIGGLWSASLLVLTMAFKTKPVTLQEGAPAEIVKNVTIGKWNFGKRGTQLTEEWTAAEKAKLKPGYAEVEMTEGKV
jgi:hypothetical protein